MIEAILLGIAQDAGVPQAGCICSTCAAAYADPAKRQLVICLGLIDHNTRQCWMIDATPDFRDQLHLLQQAAPGYQFAGILLTHAHMGHYTGLIHLGKEGWNTDRLPVYASESMAAFLQSHAPWSQLIAFKNIVLHVIYANVLVPLSPQAQALPIPVPHRNEWSDTFAFTISGPVRQLFYCPDINDWAEWDVDIAQFLADKDIALLDGCFFSQDELPHRDFSQIAHPLVTDTVERLGRPTNDIVCIHLNHTNPLLQPGPQLDWFYAQGYTIGSTGQRWNLST